MKCVTRTRTGRGYERGEWKYCTNTAFRAVISKNGDEYIKGYICRDHLHLIDDLGVDVLKMFPVEEGYCPMGFGHGTAFNKDPWSKES